MRRYLAISLTALAIVAVSVLFGYIVGYDAAERELQPETHTDTVVRVDTVWRELPPDVITQVQWRTRYVHDTAIVTMHDSVAVWLPYEQHMLAMRDTLDLWYSGVDARVDSLRIYLRTTSVTTATTLNATPRRNTIGVEAGFHDASILYIRDIGRLSLGFSAGYTYDRQATARGFVGWRF